ncbi:MAG: hypothetical protein LBP89_08565 [Helicobacteraceae bacterium]|jgi:hypothetical protein|nr:hypothetical protein [Helicobacteraceae bacterium]
MKKLFIVFVIALAFFGCGSDKETQSGLRFQSNLPIRGVWWWHSDLISDDRYLEFAANNDINEIYLSTNNFGEVTGDFIEKARSKGIKVFLLEGDYTYIENDDEILRIIDNFLDYQYTASDARRFAGIHLDIEPHQYPDFGDRRAEILVDYLDLIIRLSDKLPIDIDIPFWFDDEINYSGENVPLYYALIDRVDRTFIMSYRDSALEMYNESKDEIEAAKALNKTIILGAETYSQEGDKVSYMEEGKRYMYDELNKLKDYISYPSIGVSIHQIKTWYDLQE